MCSYVIPGTQRLRRVTEDDYGVSSSSVSSPRSPTARFSPISVRLSYFFQDTKLSEALVRVKELEQLVEHLRKKAKARGAERSSESKSNRASQREDDELSSEGCFITSYVIAFMRSLVGDSSFSAQSPTPTAPRLRSSSSASKRHSASVPNVFVAALSKGVKSTKSGSVAHSVILLSNLFLLRFVSFSAIAVSGRSSNSHLKNRSFPVEGWNEQKIFELIDMAHLQRFKPLYGKRVSRSP